MDYRDSKSLFRFSAPTACFQLFREPPARLNARNIENRLIRLLARRAKSRDEPIPSLHPLDFPRRFFNFPFSLPTPRLSRSFNLIKIKFPSYPSSDSCRYSWLDERIEVQIFGTRWGKINNFMYKCTGCMFGENLTNFEMETLLFHDIFNRDIRFHIIILVQIFDRALYYRFKSRQGRRDKPYHFHSRRNNAPFTRVNPERHNSFQPAFMVGVKNKSARVWIRWGLCACDPPQEGDLFFFFLKPARAWSSSMILARTRMLLAGIGVRRA